MTVQEVQSKITSTEFVLWMEYLESELKEFQKQDYYLAQIAAEVRRANVKNPKAVKLSDFLLSFTHEKKAEKAIEEDAKKGIERMKQFWNSVVGIGRAK